MSYVSDNNLNCITVYRVPCCLPFNELADSFIQHNLQWNLSRVIEEQVGVYWRRFQHFDGLLTSWFTQASGDPSTHSQPPSPLPPNTPWHHG